MHFHLHYINPMYIQQLSEIRVIPSTYPEFRGSLQDHRSHPLPSQFHKSITPPTIADKLHESANRCKHCELKCTLPDRAHSRVQNAADPRTDLKHVGSYTDTHQWGCPLSTGTGHWTTIFNVPNQNEKQLSCRRQCTFLSGTSTNTDFSVSMLPAYRRCFQPLRQ
jgi:hypothetical protein